MAWPWWWEASSLGGIHPLWWALLQHLTVSPCVVGLFRRLSLRGKGYGAVDQIYICTRHGQPLDESCGVCRSRVSQQWWWAAVWRCSVLGWDVTIYHGAVITQGKHALLSTCKNQLHNEIIVCVLKIAMLRLINLHEIIKDFGFSQVLWE